MQMIKIQNFSMINKKKFMTKQYYKTNKLNNNMLKASYKQILTSFQNSNNMMQML